MDVQLVAARSRSYGRSQPRGRLKAGIVPAWGKPLLLALAATDNHAVRALV